LAGSAQNAVAQASAANTSTRSTDEGPDPPLELNIRGC